MIRELAFVGLYLSIVSTMVMCVTSKEMESNMTDYRPTPYLATQCLSENSKKNFEGKHYSTEKNPSNANAKRKSCERNMNFPNSKSPTNTVVFTQDISIGYEGYEKDQFPADSCGAYFSTLFFCRNVNLNPTSRDDCSSATCFPCKTTFKNIKKDYGYYASIEKSSGHFENDRIHYIDRDTNTWAKDPKTKKIITHDSNECQ